MTIETRTGPTHTDRVRPAGTTLTSIAWLLAVASIAFAVVNVVFEVTGRFDDGPLAEFSAGLSVVNWFVAVVKVVGAIVAVLSISRLPRASARLVNTLIWGAAGVLSVYSIGSVAQAVAIGAGRGGPGEHVDFAGIVYVLSFLLAAAGFVALAYSHTERSEVGPATAVIGSIGGVALLGTILLVLPWLLSALGMMPSP